MTDRARRAPDRRCRGLARGRSGYAQAGRAGRGTYSRACGAASFRRAKTLAECLEEARAQMAHLKQQGEDDPGAPTRRQQAARERVPRKRQARLEPALARLPELADIKAKQGKPPETARASITDAEARVIKMADGGFRPAYNGQFATDTASQVIVGVDAVTVGTDRGQLAPMLEQVGERCARIPAQCGSSAQSAVEIHPIHSVLRPPNEEADRPGAGATIANTVVGERLEFGLAA